MSKQNKNTRKITATTLSAALVASAIVPVAVSAAENISFPDIPKGSESEWYRDAVTYLANENIIQGDHHGNFNPKDDITRASVAEILYKALKLPKGKDSGFTDVENTWYTDAVNAVVTEGIFQGASADKFRPNAKITRAEVAKVIVDTYDIEGEADLSEYPDVDEIKEWAKVDNDGNAKNYLAIAVENNIINGKLGIKDGPVLAPNDKISRAEVATIVMRAINAVEAKKAVEEALEKVLEGTATVEDFETVGIEGVTEDNLDEVKAAIDTANPAPTTKDDVQAIVDGLGEEEPTETTEITVTSSVAINAESVDMTIGDTTTTATIVSKGSEPDVTLRIIFSEPVNLEGVETFTFEVKGTTFEVTKDGATWNVIIKDEVADNIAKKISNSTRLTTQDGESIDKTSGGLIGLDLGIINAGILDSTTLENLKSDNKKKNNIIEFTVDENTALDATLEVAVHTLLGGRSLKVEFLKENAQGNYERLTTFTGSSGGALFIPSKVEFGLKDMSEGNYVTILQMGGGLTVAEAITFKLLDPTIKNYSDLAIGNVVKEKGQAFSNDKGVVVSKVNGTSIDGETTIEGEHGTLTVNASGAYTYVAAKKSDPEIDTEAYYNSGLAISEPGITDEFSYTLKSDGKTAIGKLTINVQQ